MKEKKEIVYTGKLSVERFEQIAEERGYSKEIQKAPKGTLFSGHLDVEKLKELCYAHLDLKSDSDNYDPRKNLKVITLECLTDGSWKATKTKNGALVHTRELIPEHALQAILTLP